MELNLVGNKKIYIKESLDFYKEHIVGLNLGFWEEALDKSDCVYTKKNITVKDIEKLEIAFRKSVSTPKDYRKLSLLSYQLIKILDNKNHTMVHNSKPMKLNWWNLMYKSDMPVKLLAGAVLGFFYSEFRINSKG